MSYNNNIYGNAAFTGAYSGALAGRALTDATATDYVAVKNAAALKTAAKASAAIIASLPFIVAILTYLSSPRYIELLWTMQAGKVALAISAVWMTFGVLVMRKMINFDF